MVAIICQERLAVGDVHSHKRVMAECQHQQADSSLHEGDHHIEEIPPEPPDPDPEERDHQNKESNTGFQEQDLRVYSCHERHDRETVVVGAGLKFRSIERREIGIFHGGLDNNKENTEDENTRCDEDRRKWSGNFMRVPVSEIRDTSA